MNEKWIDICTPNQFLIVVYEFLIVLSLERRFVMLPLTPGTGSKTYNLKHFSFV